MKDIVLIGASGHAHLVIDCVEKERKYRVVGLLDRGRAPGSLCCGYEVLGDEADLPALASRGVEGVLVAIGDNWIRSRVVERITPSGVPFVTSVHPFSELGRGVEIGEGSLVLGGVVVNTNAKIGRHCILGSRSSLNHDSVMGDYSSLGPNATTGGNARIGEYAAIAITASVLHQRSVGAHAVVGAGAVVIRDIPEYTVAYGTPARVVRRREAGEKYL